MNATLGTLLTAQVERAKEKRMVRPIVTLAAEFPGDGSQVSMDWWLQQINMATKSLNIQFDYADPDAPAEMVDKSDNPLRVAQLQRKLEEAQAYITDLENHLEDKVAEKVEVALGRQASTLSDEEAALRAVETQGFYIDSTGATWTDIQTEAKRIGQGYINLWRAAKGQTKTTSVESWVVGTTNANGDRLLVKRGSFVKAKRSKKGTR